MDGGVQRWDVECLEQYLGGNLTVLSRVQRRFCEKYWVL